MYIRKLFYWTGLGLVLTALAITLIGALVNVPVSWLGNIGAFAVRINQEVFWALASIGAAFLLLAAPLKIIEMWSQRD